MDYFSRRNAVILALLQAGVVVAGVLGAGAAYKWHVHLNFVTRVPALTCFVCDYGFLALAVPAAWATVALLTLKDEEEAGPRWLVFLSGLGISVLLVAGFFQAVVVPLAFLFCGCGGLSA